MAFTKKNLGDRTYRTTEAKMFLSLNPLQKLRSHPKETAN